MPITATGVVDMRIEEVALRAHRRVVQNCLAELRRRTPVDTGNARRGWIDSPVNSPFGRSTITNSVPYIGRLNNGWSQQAPAGFVRAAIQFGVNATRSEFE